MLFAAYAIGFNVIFGSTGQLFLCVGALAGLGGYTSAILSDRVGIPMLAEHGARQRRRGRDRWDCSAGSP